jgi:hypothetical protein
MGSTHSEKLPSRRSPPYSTVALTSAERTDSSERHPCFGQGGLAVHANLHTVETPVPLHELLSLTRGLPQPRAEVAKSHPELRQRLRRRRGATPHHEQGQHHGDKPKGRRLPPLIWAHGWPRKLSTTSTARPVSTLEPGSPTPVRRRGPPCRRPRPPPGRRGETMLRPRRPPWSRRAATGPPGRPTPRPGRRCELCRTQRDGRRSGRLGGHCVDVLDGGTQPEDDDEEQEQEEHRRDQGQLEGGVAGFDKLALPGGSQVAQQVLGAWESVRSRRGAVLVQPGQRDRPRGCPAARRWGRGSRGRAPSRGGNA